MLDTIITEDGLFYANFNSMDYTLALLEGSPKYSPELIYIKDNYGLKRGAVQEPFEDSNLYRFGLYIVNWEAYLKDVNNNVKKLKK